MRRSDAKVALEAATEWEARGMFRSGAYDVLRRELSPAANATSLATQTLYVIGGILLGAATAAFYALLRDLDAISTQEEFAWAYFAAFGVLLALIGAVVWSAGARELGDTVLLASLVPWAITLGPQTYDETLRFLPLLAGAGLVAWRRDERLLPVLGLALALASVIAFLVHALDDDMAVPWWILAAATYAGISVWMHLDAKPWRLESQILTSAHLAMATLVLIIDKFDPGFQAGFEVLFGIALLAIIGVGVLLQQRGTVGVAAAAFTIDVIVFAFDVGGPIIGFVVLLLLGGGLILAATILRRRREVP